MLGKTIGIILLALLLIGIGAGIYSLVGMYGNIYEVKGTVVKTWIDPVDGGSAYLVKIRLDNGNLKMLEVKTNSFYNHVNEDILFTSIEVNKTYTFRCWGWDMETLWIWHLYWYPNIIAIQEVI